MSGGSAGAHRPPTRKLGFGSLVATMFFIVSGGPFGLEDLIAACGAPVACLVLLVTPLLWCVPTGLIVGELAAALPDEGGYYVWVRRALGPFWGAQEAWLSLAASVFDMALYPTLFVRYATCFVPAIGDHPAVVGAIIVVACAAYNLLGAASVGNACRALAVVVAVPFIALCLACLAHATAPPPPVTAAEGSADLLGGVLVAMWNFMGWDNATTFAAEVDTPQRTYPRAVFAAVLLVTAAYVVPVACVAAAHVPRSFWADGSWATLAREKAGPVVAAAIVVGGCSSAVTTFDSLVLSYSRLPVALARDGLLPRAFARQLPRTGAPCVAIAGCAVLWTLSLGMSFSHLVMLDVLLYGMSLLLEFAALVALRVREPDLARPFRIPGGVAGAVATTIAPTLLIALSFVRTHDEALPGGASALALGALVAAGGPLLYVATARRRA